MTARMDNCLRPPAPTWDEIVGRTNEDLRAERFLADHGLRLVVELGDGSRYTAVIRRGRRRVRQFSLILAADTPPSAHSVITAVLLRAAMQPDFAQRARGFFTQDELNGLEKVL